MAEIKGYRKLTEQDLAQINEIKELENIVGNLVEILRLEPGIDKRFIAIGVTDLQKGFMALVRSIAQPESELK